MAEKNFLPVPKSFENELFGKIRYLVNREELWFVAADVCKALDLSDTSMAVRSLDDDENGTSIICTIGGK